MMTSLDCPIPAVRRLSAAGARRVSSAVVAQALKDALGNDRFRAREAVDWLLSPFAVIFYECIEIHRDQVRDWVEGLEEGVRSNNQ